MPFQDAQVVQAPPAPPRIEITRDAGRAAPSVRVNGIEISRGLPGDAALAYEAARAQRRELLNQLENLQETRGGLREEIGAGGLQGTALAAAQSRLAAVDARIAEIDAAIARSEANVAQLAGVPGAVQTERPSPNEIPEEAMVMGILMILFVFFPMALAISRRVWKRTTAGVMRLPAEWHERMTRLEQAVDAVAVEVERVTEGQRFMARVLTERGIGAGAAQPVEPGAREAVPARRTDG